MHRGLFFVGCIVDYFCEMDRVLCLWDALWVIFWGMHCGLFFVGCIVGYFYGMHCELFLWDAMWVIFVGCIVVYFCGM
jgi:hypothetical protein